LINTDINLLSGSGKTTLLNVLARRQSIMGTDSNQKLYVNGKAVDLDEFRRLSSYVEQEDALVGSLTVRETMHFAAALSLPRYAMYKDYP
jgi:ABC-type multidrug transport system ATPase subunit